MSSWYRFKNTIYEFSRFMSSWYRFKNTSYHKVTPLICQFTNYRDMTLTFCIHVCFVFTISSCMTLLGQSPALLCKHKSNMVCDMCGRLWLNPFEETDCSMDSRVCLIGRCFVKCLIIVNWFKGLVFMEDSYSCGLFKHIVHTKCNVRYQAIKYYLFEY